MDNDYIWTKVCRTCGRELPLRDFPVNMQGKDGHRNECRHCFAEKTMQRRKNDPDYQVKHHTDVHPVEKKERKPRVGNGQGSRHEYHAKRYAEHKDELKAKNIERQLGRSLEEMPKPRLKKSVKRERLCLKCVNWPCFDGIENLESDFAKEGCHGWFPRAEVV